MTMKTQQTEVIGDGGLAVLVDLHDGSAPRVVFADGSIAAVELALGLSPGRTFFRRETQFVAPVRGGRVYCRGWWQDGKIRTALASAAVICSRETWESAQEAMDRG